MNSTAFSMNTTTTSSTERTLDPSDRSSNTINYNTSVMIDRGYWADDDCDCDDGLASVRSSESACSQPIIDTLSTHQFFADLPQRRKHKRQVPCFVNEESLREMPGRRMRRSIPHFVAVSVSSDDDTVAKPVTSHYHFSRWLNEYFLSQHKLSCIEGLTTQTPESIEVVEKDVFDEMVKPRRDLPFITSCHRMLVDDAISFSLLPR